jgi:hypothetical protein
LRFARGGHTGDVHEIAGYVSKKNCSHPDVKKLLPPIRLTDYDMSNWATHLFARREQYSRRAMNLKVPWMLIKDTFVQWLDDARSNWRLRWLITPYSPWLLSY